MPDRRALAAVALAFTVGACGSFAPSFSANRKGGQNVTVQRVLSIARAGADALAQAGAAAGADVRIDDGPNSPLGIFEATVSEHGGRVSLSHSGSTRYAVSGMVTVFVPSKVPAESSPLPWDKVACVKVPAVAPGTPPPVIETERARAATVAAAGRVAIFPGLTGTNCHVLVEGPAVNRIVNPSAEVGLDGWGAFKGTIVWDSAPPGQAPAVGTHTVHIGVSSPASSGVSPTGEAKSGELYSASVWVYGPGLTLCAGINYLGADDVLLGSTQCRNPIKLERTWSRITLPSVVMPLSTVKASIYVTTLVGGGSFWMDAAQLEPGETVTSFLDGGLGAGYAWYGPKYASVSFRSDGVGVG